MVCKSLVARQNGLVPPTFCNAHLLMVPQGLRSLQPDHFRKEVSFSFSRIVPVLHCDAIVGIGSCSTHIVQTVRKGLCGSALRPVLFLAPTPALHLHVAFPSIHGVGRHRPDLPCALAPSILCLDGNRCVLSYPDPAAPCPHAPKGALAMS